MNINKFIETKTGRFTIRPYTNEDAAGVIALWEMVFNKEMNPEVWKWKFHDCPFGRQFMLCVNEDNQPVAMYASIPVPGELHGQPVTMAQIVDNISNPGYRETVSGRKGLFILTADYYYELYSSPNPLIFNYGFPGNKNFRLHILLLRVAEIKGGCAFLETDTRSDNYKGFRGFGKTEILTSVPSELDRLWERCRRFFPFSVRRDSRFLQWRFINHPNPKYRFYVQKNWRGKITAYAVTVKSGDFCILMDMLAFPGSSALRRLISRIKADCNSEGTQVVRSWLPTGHFLVKELVELGFSLKPEPLGIIPIYRQQEYEPGAQFINDNIYYTMADLDLF